MTILNIFSVHVNIFCLKEQKSYLEIRNLVSRTLSTGTNKMEVSEKNI